MSIVSEYSAQLEVKLEEAGETGMSVPDIRTWLTEEEIGPREINLIIGSGQRMYNVKWHRNGETLITGIDPDKDESRQVSKGRESNKDIPDLSKDSGGSMSSPEDHFKAIAESLGISGKFAQIAANYCFANYQMEEPDQAWTAVQECNDIGLMSRKKLWKTWMSFNQVEPPAELERTVQRWDTKTDRTKTTATNANVDAGLPAGKKFLAIDGEVIITSDDDPLGVSMSEALHIARLQLDRLRAKEPTSDASGQTSVMVEALKQVGQMAMNQQNQGDNGATAALLESNRREMDTKLESSSTTFRLVQEASDSRHAMMMEQMQRNSEHTMEMMLKNSEHHMDILKMAMEAGNHEQPPNLIDQIGQLLADETIKKFFSPAPAGPGISIRMDGGDVPLAAYKEIMQIHSQQEMVKTAKEFLPDFISAIHEVVASRKDQKELPKGGGSEQETFHSECVTCHLMVKYFNPAGFRCPTCLTMQRSDGTVIEEPAGEQQVTAVAGERALEVNDSLVPTSRDDDDQDDPVKFFERNPKTADWAVDGVMYPEPVPQADYDAEWFQKYPMVAGLSYMDAAVDANPEAPETQEAEPDQAVEGGAPAGYPVTV